MAHSTVVAALALLLPAFAAALELDWQDARGFPPGAKRATIAGNLGGPGPFALRLSFPASYAVPAHRNEREKRISVVSGELLLGLGETSDPARERILRPGSMAVIPPGQAHYYRTVEPVVIEIRADDTLGGGYIDPSQAPRPR